MTVPHLIRKAWADWKAWRIARRFARDTRIAAILREEAAARRRHGHVTSIQARKRETVHNMLRGHVHG